MLRTAYAPVEADQAGRAAGTGQQILAAFGGRITPLAVPLHYRAALFLVALAMLVLPLIYLALIGLAIWAVGWHLIHNARLWQDPSLGAMAKLLLYTGPGVVGGLLVLFMIKPLFARHQHQDRTLVLGPEDEPLLFAFVQRLCACVGSPLPREIHVDCQVNAAAGFQRGLRSMVTNDLVLTIGLPLAAGLSLRQLTGVLAHEFGHFAQTAGMRLSYVIRGVNTWFARVVYERDRWDQTLEQASQQVDLRLGIILYTARFFIWVTRRILWALMHLGHWISCLMLRQMEYDADRYEGLLTGSASFAASTERLAVLNLATQAAHQNLADAYTEGRLADDLPGLVLAHARRLSAEQLDQLRQASQQRKTRLFDTHPADADRIANVSGLPATGSFNPPSDAEGQELPASALFANFGATCRAVSARYYRELLGTEFRPKLLVPLAEIESRNVQAEASLHAADRFWLGQFSVLRPTLISRELPPPDPANIWRLEETREQIQRGLAQYRAARQAYDQADTQWLNSLPALARQALQEPVLVASVSRATASLAMEAFEGLLRERLLLLLALLRDGSTPKPVPAAAALQAQTERLFPTTAALGHLLPQLKDLRDAFTEMAALLTELGAHRQNQNLIRAVRERMGPLHARLRHLHQAVDGLGYPFEHADPAATVRSFAFADPLPADQDLAGLINSTSQALNKLYNLYSRGMASLAEIAEQVEAACGWPPLAK